MVDRISIEKINNGYLCTTKWEGLTWGSYTNHHPDMGSVIKFLNATFGEVEKVTKQIREENTNTA